MIRRGVTLIEILVAMALFMVIGGGVMYVLQSQNRSWKLSSDRATMNLTAKATLDEMVRSIRMAGSGLPDFSGGLKVFGSGEEKVVIVMNEGGGQDQVGTSTWDIANRTLSVQVNNASLFSHQGYASLTLWVPAPGSHAAAGVSLQTFTLGVVDRARANGACSEIVVLDVSRLQGPPYNWNLPGDIEAFSGSLMQNVDSLTYFKSHDTLFVKRNIQDSTLFATGIDTMRLWYHHPEDGWKDSLSPVSPVDVIDKVRLRLVFRTPRVDSKLLAQDPASRGHQFSRMETELALRNTNLTNR